MTEEQLIDGCVAGKQSAQKLLYDTYSGKMMGVCMRYTSNYEEAQDVLQDALIKVFGKIHLYKKEGSFEGWIRRIVVNTALDHIRKNKKSRETVDADSVFYLLESNDFVLENLAAEDLLKILNTIPTGYKIVFNMYAIEGYSHKEIAEKMGFSVNTSKSQYSRAKAHLRNIIESKGLGR